LVVLSQFVPKVGSRSKPGANRTDWPIGYGDRRPQAVNFCINLAIKFVFFWKGTAICSIPNQCCFEQK